MTICTQCGAHLDAGALKCDYCGLVTEAGRLAEERARLEAEQAQRRAQSEAEARARQQAQATASMEKDATNALVWAILGLVGCCSFIPSVVGLVKVSGLATRARAAGAPMPGNGRTAQWLSVLGLVVGIGFWIYAAISGTRDEQAAQRRAEAITRALADAPARPTLDQDTACKLAEYHALTHGYHDSSGTYFNSFSCPGRLQVAGDRAALEHFTFRPGSADDAVHVWVCLKRGTRWYVDSFGDSGCGSLSPQPQAAQAAQPRAK